MSSISSRRLRVAQQVLEEGIVAGAMPGATVCVLHRGEMILHTALGTQDGETPTTTDTIYDLASLTKPMATGSSLLTLIEAGKVTLTTPVKEFFGEDAPHLEKATLAHLLTHTSGLPSWTACYANGTGPEAAIREILKLPTAPPGTKYEYSCLGFILLHKIIEMVSGKQLDVYAQEHIFAPLHLTETGYRPAESLRSRIAPTVSLEGPDRDAPLVGICHDGNARGIGGVSGNAGLFGTAHEVARFGESLRHATGTSLFGIPTNARIFENQLKPEVGAHTLLFFAQGNGYCPSGDLLSPRTVGHSGYTGTLLTIDPTHAVTIALLTNAVYADGKASFLTVRRKFLNAVAAAL